MIIIDANILLYAYNSEASQHALAAAWLTDILNGTEVVGLPWVTIWAFLRISTNSRVWPNPKSVAEAFENVLEWLEQPNVMIVHPGPRHAEILQKVVQHSRANGSMVSDAALASLAFEYGAVLASSDRDFSRFEDLQWLNPLA